MFTKTTRFAVAAVAVTLFASPIGAFAETRNPSEIDACLRSAKIVQDDWSDNVQDAKVAQFDALMDAVEDKCKAGDIASAMEVLASARAMVVPE